MTPELVTINVQKGKVRYTHTLSQERYQAQLRVAEDLLQDADYISPGERQELEGILNKKRILELTNPERTRKRIEQFKEAGVPPLYDPRFETAEDSFPVLDFLMQFPTGIYQRRAAAQHAEARRLERKRVGRIIPSTLEDVFAFRTLAFDGDRLSDSVVGELEDYARTKDLGALDTDEVVKGDLLLLLKYLEQALKHLTPHGRQYESFQEGGDLSFLGRRFWHVSYTPEDRVRIAQDYARRVETCEPKLAIKKILPRMKYFFQK